MKKKKEMRGSKMDVSVRIYTALFNEEHIVYKKRISVLLLDKRCKEIITIIRKKTTGEEGGSTFCT